MRPKWHIYTPYKPDPDLLDGAAQALYCADHRAVPFDELGAAEKAAWLVRATACIIGYHESLRKDEKHPLAARPS